MMNHEQSPDGRARAYVRHRRSHELVFTVVNPAYGLYYVPTLEKCSIYTKSPLSGLRADPFLAARSAVPGDERRKYLAGDRYSRPGRSRGKCRRWAAVLVGRHADYGERSGVCW